MTAKRRPGRRILAIAGLLFLAFAIYRVFGVYTVRSGECGIVVPNRDLEEVRDRRGRYARFPARPEAAKGARPLKIMSFNIEGHAQLLHAGHIAEIAAVIRRHRPDVVGLQEVHRGTWQSRFRNQTETLARLTGMKVAYGRSFSPVRGEYGNAVLTRGTIVSADVVALPSVGEPRSLFRTTLAIDGALLDFYVTHLASWGRLRSGSRLEQVSCVAEHLRGSTHPFMLVGDFNASLDAPEMRALTANDSVRYAGDPDVPSHPLTDERIDHIFTDSGFAVLRTGVVREGPSDHWPIVAEVRWTRDDIVPADTAVAEAAR